MTRSYRLASMVLLGAASAAVAHPGHEVGNLEHLVESPDHWLPLVVSAVLITAFAVIAIKLWRGVKKPTRAVDSIRPRNENSAE